MYGQHKITETPRCIQGNIYQMTFAMNPLFELLLQARL